ncbi:MAG: AraC family transcriptional regulator [Proteobacteria bacterium]|nr:AraC family transcriptional regulator [Pseudomonadota bacterium]
MDDPLAELVTWLDPRGRMDLRCLFGETWSAPHAAIGPWRAPFHIVLRGRCELLLAGQDDSRVLEAGTLVVLPRGQAHVLRSAEPQGEDRPIRQRAGALVDLKTNLRHPARADTDILCGEFEFPGRRRSVLLDALPEPLVIAFGGRPEFAWLEGLVRLMAQEVTQQRAGAHVIVAQLSGTLFTLAVRAYLETQPELGGLLGLIASPRLGAALHAMVAQPEAPWTVASLAARCHVSRATFAREFTRRVGTGPMAVLTTLRMERAAHLLARGTQDTASIGEAVGYRSEAAFNRAFARHAGTTPGRFKRARR